VLRISKLTDYGVAIATRIAAERPGAICTVRWLAEKTAIPPPTVSKVCKLLCKGSVLLSQRGVQGGYQLSRPASQISVASVIRVIEGRLGITECACDDGGCEYESRCTLQPHWRRIGASIESLLDGISLAGLAQSEPLAVPPAGSNVRAQC